MINNLKKLRVASRDPRLSAFIQREGVPAFAGMTRAHAGFPQMHLSSPRKRGPLHAVLSSHSGDLLTLL